MKIYVKHTTAGFQWGMTPSSLTALDVPISTSSQSSVTFELLALGPTGIFYRLQNGASGKLRPGDGPTQEVPLGGNRSCSFSTKNSGNYESGIIEVTRFVR